MDISLSSIIVASITAIGIVTVAYIANVVGKPLNYEMVDFHSKRPGHDLRYSLCGEKMNSIGFVEKNAIFQMLRGLRNE